MNKVGIGIEIVNKEHKRKKGHKFKFDPYLYPYTDAQYEALEELIPQLKDTYTKILPNNVLGHSDVGVEKKGVNLLLGRKATDPGRKFDWPRFEDKRMGIKPSSEAATFSGTTAKEIYGGFFAANTSRRILNKNHPVATKGIKADLREIGYYIHSSGNGVFDLATQKAVIVFKRRFFSGSGDRKLEPEKYFEHVDFETAKMIKRVLHAVRNPPLIVGRTTTL